MAITALNTASTGMAATLFNLDVIANNLANAGTTAFKRSRTDFEDVFYQYYKVPGSQDTLGQLTPVGVAVGLGTRVQATAVDESQGSLQQTGRELDVAVGEGGDGADDAGVSHVQQGVAAGVGHQVAAGQALQGKRVGVGFVVGGIFGLLLGPLFYMRRKRDRRKLEAMRAADAVQEAALRESALTALLEEPVAPSESTGGAEHHTADGRRNAPLL